MFQMEILKGEEVYACNICDEGFETDDQAKRHRELCHNAILIQIRTNLDKEEENSNDESFGNSWLTKHDDEGHFIGLITDWSYGTVQTPTARIILNTNSS